MILPAIGLGLNVAGGLMGRAEAQKDAVARAQARNDILKAYTGKQSALESEGRGFLNNVMATYAPGNTQLEDAQTGRTGTILNTVGEASDPNAIPVSRSASPAVRGEIAKRMLTAFQDATERAKSMGSLGGYSDQWFNNTANNTDAARRIGTLNNFSRGESAILNSQQDLAEMAAREQPSIWGPILSAGGSLLMTAGGKGWNPFTATGGKTAVDMMPSDI